MVCLCPLRGCHDWIGQARNLLRENIIREKQWSELKKKWGVPVDYTAESDTCPGESEGRKDWIGRISKCNVTKFPSGCYQCSTRY